jgi:hypothetical protein
MYSIKYSCFEIIINYGLLRNQTLVFKIHALLPLNIVSFAQAVDIIFSFRAPI